MQLVHKTTSVFFCYKDLLGIYLLSQNAGMFIFTKYK